ncbi:septum formation protein Maf [Sulfitobacter sp. JBTF-M27]|uniref:dTTP/UTP pyrophosphatase n=1 Tax=Sulfitobacter sediminilitoris TaxID=2698830 RepID=A0A6P0C8X5_9RHOB|nr:Maf family protein [Sulfitobacter sediminilitoris]NEK22317.1 septum formation protein Maf [Sulfitobacter sediminilitoris]
MTFILGSGSPRRLELLAQIGVVPDAVRAPNIDETPLTGELPRPYCARMAREKVAAVPAGPDDIVLCADTTVALGRRILGKPSDVNEAEAFLRMMSGRRHKVVTAVAVKRGNIFWERDVQSSVKMKVLSDAEIKPYLASNDWQGKAGGYGIQGPAGAFIPWISGSFTAIVGLPLAETANLLTAAGYPLYGGAA